MGKIIELDDVLSNKIAAGEVVERPASIVKELVENSIDAKSNRIEIELEDGGLNRIRVIDNGEGMDKSDSIRAFRRHATSKLKHEQDLFEIRTLGFRGEALPSIGAVSNVIVKTSTGEGPGTEVHIKFGKEIESKSCKARQGTDIEVTQLFHNTPARLKHLKTVNTELANVTDVINRLSLAHPEIAFHFKHNGRPIIQTSGNGQLIQVIASIYGMSVAKKMETVGASSLDFRVSGFVAKPEVTRASRNYMSLFINGRYLKNFPVFKAIQNAYHTLLPIGRYPVTVLSIEMDPKLIDVNVHPSKLEARISKEEELTKLIENAIKNVFKQTELIPSGLTKPKQTPIQSEQSSFQFEPQNNRSSVLLKEHKGENEAVIQEDLKETFSHHKSSPLDRYTNKIIVEEQEVSVQPISDLNNTHSSVENDEFTDSATSQLDGVRIPILYPIGQLHGTYILAQNENGLYIIDQHAAQERIKYEFYREKVGEIASEVQELLVPITFEFSKAESLIIKEYIQELEKIGIFLEEFGPLSFIVRSHPQWFPEGDEKEIIEEIIEQILKYKQISIKKLREEAAIMMSCKGSIKANHHLRDDEVEALLEQLRHSSDPYTCPHGRPIIVHFSTYEMEKMFKRVM